MAATQSRKKVSALRIKFKIDDERNQAVSSSDVIDINIVSDGENVPPQDNSIKLFNHLITEDSETRLVSSTPKIFAAINEFDFNDDFYLSEEELDIYIEGFMLGIKENIGDVFTELLNDGVTQKDLIESALDDTDIKLSLYRSFKSLNDKWISNSEVSSGANEDKKVGTGYFFNNYGDKTVDAEDNRTLFEHFDFVNRTGSDIGGKAVVDVSYLSNLSNTKNGQGPTQSLYQSITNLLSKNNFDFFALPSFISYSDRNKDDLTDMFKAFSGPLNPIESKPKFVCMFIGGSSKALDIPRSSCGSNGTEFDYTDDSFDINEPTTYPEDFKENGGITAFKVRFGQETQNHFSSIELDQAEFKETQESLLVIDALTNPETGSSPSQIGKGNNIFDLYLTRSYSCEVTALGNINIQPLMFFKLENVPMFRGTYLIIDVKHEVKPHNVITKFKGVRQPIVTVPLVTDALSILDLTLSNVTSDDETTSLASTAYSVGDYPTNGKYPPTKVGNTTNNMTGLIIKNGGVNGAPDSKEMKSENSIKLKEFMPAEGLTLESGGKVKWGGCVGQCRKFLKEGIEPFKEMLKDLDNEVKGLTTYLKKQENFNKALEVVTSQLIGKEEEEVVPIMTKEFGKFGFTFEETGVGDAMIVKFGGTPIDPVIDLDPSFTSTEISEAARLKDFLKTNFASANPKEEKEYDHIITIDGMFRPIAKQQELYDRYKAGNGNLAAVPGTSNHGWGIAIDWQWSDKDGKKVLASSNCSKPNDRWTTEQYEWLFQNSPSYGFVNTATLRDGSKGDEVWHWLYVGTDAFNYMKQNPRSRGCGKVDLVWNSTNFKLKSSVKNPIDLETNKLAVFDSKSQKNSDEKAKQTNDDDGTPS